MGAIPVLLVGATVVLYLWVGIRAESPDDDVSRFFMYGNKLEVVGLLSTVANSSISLGAAILAFLSLGYAYPGVSIVAVLSWLAGFYFHYLVMRGVFPAAATGADRLFTIHGWMGRQYDCSVLRVLASFATIMGFCGAFGVEMVAITKLLEPYYSSKLVHLAVLIVFSVCLAAYVAKGGYSGIVKTGYYQFALFYIPIFLCLGFVFVTAPAAAVDMTIEQFEFSHQDWPAALVIGLLVVNLPWQIVDLSQWQRSLSSVSFDVVRRGLLFGALAIFIAWGVLIVLGAAMHAVPLDNDPVRTFLIRFAGHPGWYGIFLVAGVAAMFSTADAYVIAAVQTLACDVNFPELLLGGYKPDSPHVLKYARRAVWVICIVFPITAFGANMFIPGMLDLFFIAFSAQLSLLPSIVIARFCPAWRVRAAAVSSVGCGAVASFGLFIWSLIDPPGDLIFYFPVITAAISIAIYALVGLPGCVIAKRAG